MACLLPQFKCPQDTLPTHFKTHFKTRESRGQCIMSMTTHMVVDVESLQIPCLELHSNTITSPIGPSTSYIPHLEKSNFEATLAKEALLTGEEATIAAAASEAVALAMAAVEVAHDVALMMKSNPSTESHNIPTRIPSKTDILRLKRVHFPKMVQASIIGHLATATGPEWSSENFSILDFDEMEKSDAGCSFPMTQLSTSIDVRSRRQTERRARREKVTAKAAATFFSEKSGSTRRKKRITVQDVDNSDSLQFLRGTTITSKLLTANEELKLSEGIQDMLKLERLRKEVTERCAGQPTFAQWATAAGTDKKTLRKRLNYGMFCKDKMVKSNIRLVISIAKNYQGAGMNLQDLVQEGCRGLVKGSEKFDASKGFKFSTYAHWWIRQAVRKSLSDHSRTIRLPFHMVEATYRVREAKKQLYSETRRQPSNEEIAKAAGLSMKRLTAVLLIPKAPRSLDQKIGFMNLKPLEVTADPNAETGEDLQKKQSMKRDLDKVLNSLSQRENQVIRWRFGLEDGKMRTLQEIGELIGVSRERIRQIESCAFRKLKNKRRTKILQQYAIS